MKRISSSAFLFYFLVLLFSGCASGERLYLTAPSLLPHTERAMKTPGFWIAQNSSPDQVVFSPQEIEDFNAAIQNELKLTKDITRLPRVMAGEELKASLEKTFKEFSQNGNDTTALFNTIHLNMNLDAVPSQITPQFGLVVRYADQRFFPTEEGWYAIRGDIDFDELQNNALDAGTPVAVLHRSLDGRWFYVESPSSDGWVKAEYVALGKKEDIKEFISSASFVIVTRAKADIYLDPQLKEYYDYVQMGVKLPFVKKDKARVQVRLPWRGEDGSLIFKSVYVREEDVNQGYLAYTPRNTIEQAFELINEPYGWGGMYGEQDCSRFLQEIFAVFGINLPRNSSAQAKTGKLLGQFDAAASDQKKTEILQQAPGGVTILPMKGHIMLYLGMADGRAYAIHAVWAYREKGWRKDRVRVINRVAVTDLSLGEGSRKGSLLKRLTAVRSLER